MEDKELQEFLDAMREAMMGSLSERDKMIVEKTQTIFDAMKQLEEDGKVDTNKDAFYICAIIAIGSLYDCTHGTNLSLQEFFSTIDKLMDAEGKRSAKEQMDEYNG